MGEEDLWQLRNPECWGFTGGTCAVFGCHAERRAVCKSWFCVCDSGCAGLDGKCHQKQSKLIASGIKFESRAWPSHYLHGFPPYFSFFGRRFNFYKLGYATEEGSKFRLHALPADEGYEGFV